MRKLVMIKGLIDGQPLNHYQLHLD
jgi:hypothetical protein